MGKTSYQGQGPRSRGQAITQGHGRTWRSPPDRRTPTPSQPSPSPEHWNNSNVRRPNDNDLRPSDNDCCPNGNESRQVVDSTRAPVHERLGPVQRQRPVHRCNNKSVPPQGLIPNLKRKLTPSVAPTSSGTSTTTDPNYEAPAPNTGSNTSVEADSRPRSRE
jgi:hypothetical protein